MKKEFPYDGPEAASQGSLEKFFFEQNPTNLDNCDRELVHLTGSVQAQGALIAVDPESLNVLAYSQNLGELLELSPLPPPSFPLTQILPELGRELSDNFTRRCREFHASLSTTTKTSTATFDGVYHEHKGVGILEFLPDRGLTPDSYREKLRLLRRYCTRIIQAPTLDEALQATVEAGKDITGFARIKIYEFQSDWSGKVVAEAKDSHMPSYLGLCFPDTDIPKQARYLLSLVPVRSLASTDDFAAHILHDKSVLGDQPLDLSWSLLRSASKIHTQYLRNMNVSATMSVSIHHRGKLWGLIAGHHDQEGLIPFELWGAMHDLATAFMARLDQENAKKSERVLVELRELETKISKVSRDVDSLEEAVSKINPHLRQFLQADGSAIRYGTKLYTDGATPPESFILELIEWAARRSENSSSFVTNALQKEWPEAGEEHKNTACGVLIESAKGHRACQLIWFRGPVTKTVQWAGNPTDKKHEPNADGDSVMVPRASFASWVQTHSNQSLDWSETDQHSAHELFRNMLEVLLRQIQHSHSSKNRETFSFAAAHDLKTPLRHIQVALDLLGDLDTSNDRRQVELLISRATASSQRLQLLIEKMLRYLVLDRDEITLESVSLDAAFKDACDLLKFPIEESGATIDCAPLPELIGNHELLTILLNNLIGNSITYRETSRPLRISIGARSRPGHHEIVVTDNGQGIPEEFSKVVFEPFRRLHSHDQIAGSGFGLAICQRVVELHHGSISVDNSYSGGARIVVCLQD